MAATDPAPDTRRAGLHHRARTDTLEVRLVTGPPLSPLVGTLAQDRRRAVRVRLQHDDDGRLVALVLQAASTKVPAAILKGRAEPLSPPGPLTDDPSVWFVPLFGGADLAARRYLALHVGTEKTAVSVALSSSGRVVGFLVADAAAQLPQELVAPTAET